MLMRISCRVLSERAEQEGEVLVVMMMVVVMVVVIIMTVGMVIVAMMLMVRGGDTRWDIVLLNEKLSDK